MLALSTPYLAQQFTWCKVSQTLKTLDSVERQILGLYLANQTLNFVGAVLGSHFHVSIIGVVFNFASSITSILNQDRCHSWDTSTTSTNFELCDAATP